MQKGYYDGPVTTDQYGRQMPKHAHGTQNLEGYSSSTMIITKAVVELFDRIVDKNLLVRKINITANRIIPESDIQEDNGSEQLDLFTDYDALEKKRAKEKAALEREKKMQKAMLGIKNALERTQFLKE